MPLPGHFLGEHLELLWAHHLCVACGCCLQTVLLGSLRSGPAIWTSPPRSCSTPTLARRWQGRDAAQDGGPKKRLKGRPGWHAGPARGRTEVSGLQAMPSGARSSARFVGFGEILSEHEPHIQGLRQWGRSLTGSLPHLGRKAGGQVHWKLLPIADHIPPCHLSRLDGPSSILHTVSRA